jgi:murein DD-endopeptidase MepM/ murein hydrolase activator NlpD
LLNASVGVQRALARLRPATSHRTSTALTIQRHSLAAAESLRGLVLRLRRADVARWVPRAAVRQGAPVVRHAAPLKVRTREPRVAVRHVAPSAQVAPRSACATVGPLVSPKSLDRRSLISRIGADRAVPAVAVAILLVATAISSAPTLGLTGAEGPVGGTTGDGSAARIAAGGVMTSDSGPQGAIDDGTSDVLGVIDDREPASVAGSKDVEDVSPAAAGLLDDGTILKPVAVDTTVADGKSLMRAYRVRSGDTLTGIARKHGVSMMTVWWANNLKSKDDLHIGQTLMIPPTSGVVVTVGASDTLETLAAKYHVEPAQIIEANGLEDPNLILGQTLTLPGALGAGIATPAPTPAPTAAPRPRTTTRTTVRAPAQYTGGAFAWPVAGGYISQYFHYGHYAIDIAADYGTRVSAAAAGTVTFAGWKSNGGGYQVWISHGSNLYTTYNHMSSISVGRGQHVSRGQQVGRIGQSGNATGPHLHFEVWRGPIWDGGTRVNPLGYL